MLSPDVFFVDKWFRSQGSILLMLGVQVLVDIMGREECQDILCDVGMPVVHKSV